LTSRHETARQALWLVDVGRWAPQAFSSGLCWFHPRTPPPPPHLLRACRALPSNLIPCLPHFPPASGLLPNTQPARRELGVAGRYLGRGAVGLVSLQRRSDVAMRRQRKRASMAFPTNGASPAVARARCYRRRIVASCMIKECNIPYQTMADDRGRARGRGGGMTNACAAPLKRIMLGQANLTIVTFL